MKNSLFEVFKIRTDPLSSTPQDRYALGGLVANFEVQSLVFRDGTLQIKLT
jgi:hypothetical protein